MPEKKLNKIEHVALSMVQGNTDLVRVNGEAAIKVIVEAFRFAVLFVDIAEDPEMTWNRGEK